MAEPESKPERYVRPPSAESLGEAPGRARLKGSRILILGVAYKPDIGDSRETPAEKLIHLLKNAGATVAYHDLTNRSNVLVDFRNATNHIDAPGKIWKL